jgi:GT2 family glycosyltransferase
MNTTQNKLTIGLLTYGASSAKYLPDFFASLAAQTYQDYRIIVIDNSERQENENSRYFKEKLSDIEFVWAGSNLGFAKAYNRLIDNALKAGSEYFLALNMDMILEPTAIEKLLAAIEREPMLGSASPKILRWDFTSRRKTDLIDSCGLVLQTGLRFVDLGQGEGDRGQYDGHRIIGASGAAALYRLSALKKISEDGRFFDELMFMYKEDCDLAYRLALAGFGAVLVPDAIVYHDRTAATNSNGILGVISARTSKSRQVKQWSFVNQCIIYRKYWRLLGVNDKAMVVWRLSQMLFFAFIFEPFLISELVSMWKKRNKIKIYG